MRLQVKMVQITKDKVMARGHERLGSHVLPREFEDIQLKNTSHNNSQSVTQNEQTYLQSAEELDAT